MTWFDTVMTSVCNVFSDLLKSQRGAVVVLWALAAIPIIVGVGASVDLSRAYMARTRLAFALDAAGLAAGSTGNTEADAGHCRAILLCELSSRRAW